MGGQRAWCALTRALCAATRTRCAPPRRPKSSQVKSTQPNELSVACARLTRSNHASDDR